MALALALALSLVLVILVILRDANLQEWALESGRASGARMPDAEERPGGRIHSRTGRNKQVKYGYTGYFFTGATDSTVRVLPFSLPVTMAVWPAN